MPFPRWLVRITLNSGEEAQETGATGKSAEQRAVYANRQRLRGEYGKSVIRQRGELIERSFAHLYETGGMRRTHLRGHPNILKRVLIHAGAFNLSLLLRKLVGTGTPRGLQGCTAAFSAPLSRFQVACGAQLDRWLYYVMTWRPFSVRAHPQAA